MEVTGDVIVSSTAVGSQQKIVWANNADLQTSSVTCSDVTIDVSCCNQSALGSSAVVVKSIIDYPFMLPGPNSIGLAVHRSQEYIAYALNKAAGPNPPSGMVRIINTVNNARGLIKGINGLITDLSFAWLVDKVLLAFVDTTGTFNVYEITFISDQEPLCMKSVVVVEGSGSSSSCLLEETIQHQYRVTWCRYIPEYPKQPQLTDVCPPYLLAVTLGNTVEVWQLFNIWQMGIPCQVSRPLCNSPSVHVFHFNSPVTATAVSPDSTCVAIAASDGFVRFYQIDADDDRGTKTEGGRVYKESNCVHSWAPHKKATLSCLYFLDNHTAMENAGVGSFWKFVMTGVRNNTELKLWTCKTWTCLQTITFNLPSSNTVGGGLGASSLPTTASSPPSTSAPPSTRHSPSMRCASLSPSLLQHNTQKDQQPMGLHMFLDESSNFILLLDRSQKVLYLLILDMVPNFKTAVYGAAVNNGGGTNGDADATDGEDCLSSDVDQCIKRVVSVSEMPVTFSPLGAVINSAKIKLYQRWQHDHDSSTVHVDGEGTTARGVVLHCNLLTTKSLYECVLRLQPKVATPEELAEFCIPLAQEQLSSEEPNDDSTLPSRDVHDGLTDVSLSLPDDVTAQATAPPPTFPLSELLPPTHFTAPSPKQTPESSPQLDSHLNNKANPTLAALLLCPDKQAATAIIAATNPNGEVAAVAPNAGAGRPLNAACSSTSSPSLEIQQILQHNDSGKSSVASSSSNSRGPTQLDMTESVSPDTSLKLKLHHTQTDSQIADFTTVLRLGALASGGTVPGPAVTAGETTALNIFSQLVNIPNQPTSLVPAAADSTIVSEEDRQRQSVRDIHQKLLDEQRAKEECTHTQQQELQNLHQQDQLKFLLNLDATSPSVSAKSADEGGPPVKLAPQQTDFLQTLLPGLAVPSTENHKQAPTAPPLGDLFGGTAVRENLAQLTCEELEAKIKGNSLVGPHSSTSAIIATNSNAIMTANTALNGSVSQQQEHTAPFDDLESYLKSLPTTLPNHPLPTSSSATAAPAVDIKKITLSQDSSLQYDILPRCTANVATGIPTTTTNTVTNGLGRNDCIPALMSLPRTPVDESVNTPPLATVPGVVLPIVPEDVKVKNNAALHYTNNTKTQTDAPILPTTASVGTQHVISSRNWSGQVTQPPPTVLCKHPSNSDELRQLRSLIVATQQQYTKINKRLDELSGSLSRHSNSHTPRAVAAAVTPALEEAVRATVRQTLPQCIATGLETSMSQQVSHELQRMVSATEARLADNISKMLHSRSFSDSLSSAVCGAVAPSVTAACRDAYTKLVLPGFNTLTTRILQQFNDLFHKGTTEYLLQVKGEVSGVVSAIESSASGATREMDGVKTAASHLLKTHQDLIQQHQAAMQQHANHVISESAIRRAVCEEVSRALAALQRGPGPGTPALSYYAPGPDKVPSPKQAQLQLEQLIAAKQFNSAFKQALSANDLTQVLFVCERVNRESLMSTGNSKLSQEVLMSLINQLSHDLGQKTDLKMKFLEDALLCIDLSHPVTREHIRTVAGSLQRNLQAYLDTSPPAHTLNRFKMMLLAATHHATASAPS